MTSGPTSLSPTTPMTTFPGLAKGSIASETQVAHNNFKRVQKGIHQHIPSSRMIFTTTHFRDLSLQPSRRKDSMMLLIQILILMMEINMKFNYFWRNNLLCILSWLLLFKLIKEENWSRSLKERQGPFFPTTTTILSQMLHELTGLDVMTAVALLDTQKGPVIGMFYEYTHFGMRNPGQHPRVWSG